MSGRKKGKRKERGWGGSEHSGFEVRGNLHKEKTTWEGMNEGV